MIDPSAVNLFSLPSVSLKNRFDLPMTPAVYLAIDAAGKVKYVGRTKSLWRRWNTAKHHRYNQLLTIGEIQIAWIEISDPKLLPEIEKALIAWFKPPLNGTRIERANTENKFPVEYLCERLTQTAQLLRVFRQYGYECNASATF